MRYLIVLLLAGCASGPQMPERVEVPVQIPCIERAPDRPQTTPDAVLLALDDYRLVLTMRLDLLALRDYAALAEAAISGCM